MLKKLLAALGTLALIGGLVALVAGPASAHSHSVDATCAAGVNVNLTNYALKDGNPTPNHVAVWTDDATSANPATAVVDQDFGTTFQNILAWKASPAASHTYRVVVTAYDDAQYSFDTGVVVVKSCAESSTAGNVTAYPATCTAEHTYTDGGYTIPNSTTATFTATTTTAAGVVISKDVPVGEGVHKVDPGFSVHIAASPISDAYTLADPKEWDFPFPAIDSSKCIVPTPPTPSTSICDVNKPGSETGATYTIPITVDGVTYTVNGQPVGEGTYPVSVPGSVDIKIVIPGGYLVPNGTQLDYPYTFDSAGACISTTTASYPTFVEQTCNADKPGQTFSGTYLLSRAADQHVHFTVTVNGTPVSPTPVVGTTYSVDAGDLVVVTITADSGYTITDVLDPALLMHRYSATALSCLKNTSAVKPSTTAESCLPDGGGLSFGQAGAARTADRITQGFITIPSTEGVQYFVTPLAVGGTPSGATTPVASGPLDEAPGDYQVTAAAKLGYSLVLLDATHPDGYPEGGWTVTVGSDQLCSHPLVDPAASHVDLGCFASGSYTLGNDLNDPAALTWTVNGSTVTTDKAPKTFTVSEPGTVTVVATANGPSYGLEFDAQTVWTFDFTQSTTCDLKTLALTGSSPTGWLTLGYLMLVSGLALVAARFVRRRDEQA